MLQNVRLIIATTIALMLFSASVTAQMYRYKDESGRTVMSANVPPQLVKKGYEILNTKGRVIEVVPPALTPEQIVERDRRLEEERKAEEALAAQKEYDKTILRQYGTPEGAATLLQRRLEEFDALIKSRRNSIELANKSIAENEEKAAAFQRNGRAIPTRVIEAIEKSEQDIVLSEQLIKEKTEARAALVSEFKRVIERLEELTGQLATAVPEKS